jgi:hypothetical protein
MKFKAALAVAGLCFVVWITTSSWITAAHVRRETLVAQVHRAILRELRSVAAHPEYFVHEWWLTKELMEPMDESMRGALRDWPFFAKDPQFDDNAFDEPIRIMDAGPTQIWVTVNPPFGFRFADPKQLCRQLAEAVQAQVKVPIEWVEVEIWDYPGPGPGRQVWAHFGKDKSLEVGEGHSEEPLRNPFINF